MNLTFNNGQTISFTNINEQKRIYSEPKVWELTIRSSEDLTSDELDTLFIPENISTLTYEKDGEIKEINGYSSVEMMSKNINENGITLTITLLKEVTENENQVQE